MRKNFHKKPFADNGKIGAFFSLLWSLLLYCSAVRTENTVKLTVAL